MSSTIQGVIADRFAKPAAYTNTLLVFGAIGLISMAAQIQIPMYPVPMTLQTLVVLLVAATLGMKRSAIALTGYLAIGALGLPVFAGSKALTGVLPTTGYLVGFIVAAMIVGFLAEKGFSRKPLAVLASFALGSLVIYGFGTAGLMVALGLDLNQAIAVGVIPFLIGDAVKAAVAAAALPLAWKLTRQN